MAYALKRDGWGDYVYWQEGKRENGPIEDGASSSPDAATIPIVELKAAHPHLAGLLFQMITTY